MNSYIEQLARLPCKTQRGLHAGKACKGTSQHGSHSMFAAEGTEAVLEGKHSMSLLGG
jgi:hypothetical protein